MRTVSLCFVLAVSVAGAPAWGQNPATAPEAGTNQITSIQGGCVLVENWKGAQNSTGNSFNMFYASRDDGKTWKNLFDGLYVPAGAK